MSDKKRKNGKTIGSVYVSKIAVHLIIALAVTISVIVIAMPTAVKFVHKVQSQFPISNADIQISNDLTEISKADYGAKIGTLEGDSFGLNCNIYYGANRVSMRYGAGLSAEKTTVGKCTYITGYSESFFAPLHYVKAGDIITFKTSDSDTDYKVIDTGFVESGKAEYSGNYENVLVLSVKETNLSEHSGSDFCVIAVSAEEVG